tara:strand:- start:572 stop:775 length:204 start_codon:yes stop_codon:yes gene_type:complete
VKWVIDALSNRNILAQGKSKFKYADGKRLKYCEYCDHVWEIDGRKICMRYKHMPTFGLKRLKCKYCK